MDLNEIRQQIDTVDNEIVALLEERMKLTRVSAYKQRTGKAIYDPEREQALLDKVAAECRKSRVPRAYRSYLQIL